jgi:hypothetical protein
MLAGQQRRIAAFATAVIAFAAISDSAIASAANSATKLYFATRNTGVNHCH